MSAFYFPIFKLCHTLKVLFKLKSVQIISNDNWHTENRTFSFLYLIFYLPGICKQSLYLQVNWLR
jgi:hypothetical protein